jgi:hypothetical protein
MPSSDCQPRPVKNDTFVPWGHYDDIDHHPRLQAVRSRLHHGSCSGNGKTTMIEQICADLRT